MRPQYPVIWIDPGKATGIAMWSPEAGFHVFEDQFGNACDRIESACRYWNTALRLGWEHFSILPGTPPDDAHHAIEMIGVCRRYMHVHACKQIGPAMPGQRKLATMAMLKALGWWVPGKDDAQSAAQHLLAWMLRTGNTPDDISVKLAELRAKDDDDDGSGQRRAFHL